LVEEGLEKGIGGPTRTCRNEKTEKEVRIRDDDGGKGEEEMDKK